MSARPKWFLNWTAASASAPEGDGRPWGDGSQMAGRQARSLDPWDENCGVRPILGGFEAMSSMAQALQGVIDEAANVSAPFDTGSRKWVNGHVYIADWRFNCLRDLSHENAWLTDAWGSNTTATRDLTAIGLVRKLMQAGIQVRVMLWLPSWLGGTFADLSAHIDDHFYAARLVEAENVRLMAKFGATAPTDPPLGVVALDMRTADVVAPSHHQKQLVVRSPWRDVAFAGGVDLAYTRRDAPVLAGDWQSNSGMPKAAPAWPRENGVDYASVAGVAAPGTTPPTDLPAPVYGTERHIWHDQHLHLEGPVVATLEASFAERWALAGRVYDLGHPANVSGDQVIMSSPLALTDGAVIALPDPAPVKRPPGGLTSDTAAVQLWRTLPLHPKRTSGPHQRGEFTVMLGVAEACKQARESHLDLRSVPVEPATLPPASPDDDRVTEPACRGSASSARRYAGGLRAPGPPDGDRCARRQPGRARRRLTRRRVQHVERRRAARPRSVRARQGADVRRGPARVRLRESQPPLVHL